MAADRKVPRNAIFFAFLGTHEVGRFSGSAGKRPAGRMGPLRADSGAFLVTLLPAKESRTAGFVIAPQGAERFPTDGKKGDKRPFSEVSFIEKEMFSSHPRCPS